MLRGKTIEEIVNRWSSELETHVREFNKFAGEVSVWDRALIENGNNVCLHHLGYIVSQLGTNVYIVARCTLRSRFGRRARTK